MLEAYQGKLNKEKCLIGSGRKISIFFFFYKRCTVRRKPVIYGKINGVTKLFLAVKIVEGRVGPFCLKIISISF